MAKQRRSKVLTYVENSLPSVVVRPDGRSLAPWRTWLEEGETVREYHDELTLPVDRCIGGVKS